MITTAELIEIIRDVEAKPGFLTERFFPNVVMSESEFISIAVEGSRGSKGNYFFYAPRVGEEWSLKPWRSEEQGLRHYRKEMAEQIDVVIMRAVERYAAYILRTGTMAFERSRDRCETHIDFGRDPALTVQLSAERQWTAENVGAGLAMPVADVRGWLDVLAKKNGPGASDIVFEHDAYASFIASAEQDPRFELNTERAGEPRGDNASFKGRWYPEGGGSNDLWTYQEWYLDQEGNEQQMMPDGTVLMVAPNLAGVRAFAKIEHPIHDFTGLPFAPRTWVDESKGHQMLKVDCCPMLVPFRPNATFAATVL